MTNTAVRLISLIMLLQRRPNQKAAALAEALDVSVRTVHRYIGMLDELGIPVYSERGPHGGFSLVRGYRMPPLVLTPEEAVAVTLGTGLVEALWGELYREAARGALAKLENLLPDEQCHEVSWARRTFVATNMHRAANAPLIPRLETLRRATREHRSVEVTYRSRGRRDPLQRVVDPYVLVHRWGWWYVVAYCHLRQDVRTFRVDRMEALTLLDTCFHQPADFDVHAYLEDEPHTRPQFEVRLRFHPESALVALDERGLWERLEEQPDGAVIVSFKVPELELAIRTALSYASHAVVLEPPELYRAVRERAQALLEEHTKSSL
ncbi:MAG: helix-turn-helix transcriptional regulator [Anaerolineales bacterium]